MNDQIDLEQIFTKMESFAECTNPLTTDDAINRVFEHTGVLMEAANLIPAMREWGARSELINGQLMWLLG